MWTMAADTGGKALLDNNDLAAGIVQAQKAISSYYIIGYYTSNTALDGKLLYDRHRSSTLRVAAVTARAAVRRCRRATATETRPPNRQRRRRHRRRR